MSLYQLTLEKSYSYILLSLGSELLMLEPFLMSRPELHRDLHLIITDNRLII